MVIGTNRGNNLLMHMLKYRFPNIFKANQLIFSQKILNKTIDHCKYNLSIAINLLNLCL